MGMRHLGWIPLVAALSLSNATAAGRCKVLETPPVAVTMQGLSPTIVARINGARARFIIDTGAFYSMMSTAAATQYKLPLQNTDWADSLWGMATHIQDYSPGYSIQGFGGGQTTAKVATVEKFTYADVSLSNVQFLVGGNNMGGDAIGLLGDNLLRVADVEFDFGEGMMRLVRPMHCGGRPLIFFAKPGQRVALVKLQEFNTGNPDIIGQGAVNGHRIRILFDSGAPRSILSLAAAKRAGITPRSPHVVRKGTTWGIAGNGTVKVWSAPIADLQIGTEKIEHTHLLIGGQRQAYMVVRGGRVDMIVGEDFFLSHHIFVSYEQHRLYFTYIGGPVFDLGLPSSTWKHAAAAANVAPRTPAGAPAGAAPASGKATTPGAPVAAPQAPANASELLHRGLAYAAQREFQPALTDLKRACRLEPDSAKCWVWLGRVYWRDRQPDKALKDFNAAVKLQPDDTLAHLMRAELQEARKDWPDPAAKAAAATEIKTDLDAVARLLPPEANTRLLLGSLYDNIGEYSAAIHQVNLWLPYHRHQRSFAWGLNNLCWELAEADLQLRKALHECNRALEITPNDPSALDSRALVYLRLGRLADAIDNYDSALKRDPKQSSSLYGRGLAELREGKKAQGQADLAAAEKVDPGIAKLFARMGLKP